MTRFPALVLLWLAAGVLADPVDWQTRSWPEADRLFLGNRYWVGGDGGYSVDLGGGPGTDPDGERILWLFGDSFIDPTGGGRRDGETTRMVSNSLAIQSGRDPSRASVTFHWGRRDDGTPGAFFPDHDDERHWPGAAVVIEGRLLLFLMRVRSSDAGLGFDLAGSRALMVDRPGDDPAAWTQRELALPEPGLPLIIGSAGAWTDDEHLYAFAALAPDSRRAFLARWPLADVAQGDLEGARWWNGSRWSPMPSADGAGALANTGTEFTVHRSHDRFVLVQALGFGPAEIAVRTAARIEGPWSEPVPVYRPPEYERDGVFIYQGKAHPHLAGAELVLTYCSNRVRFADLVADRSVYQPRFVRVRR